MSWKRVVNALKRGKTPEEALRKTKDLTYYEIVAEKERLDAEKAAKEAAKK
jgi:alkylated DNA nucleotide flippase Atl1